MKFLRREIGVLHLPFYWTISLWMGNCEWGTRYL